MESGEQRSFWDRHITSWSASAYEQGQSLPFLERVAQPFRKHLTQRQDMGVSMLQQWSPIAVVELGCGTGEFAAAALGRCKTIQRYVAIDISEAAIAKVRERLNKARRDGVTASARVSSVEDLDPAEFRDFDVVVGLGLLPYLTDPGFEKLSAITKGKHFLFDDHPKEPTLFNGLHFLYRKAKGYPFYRIFSEPELRTTMAGFGFAEFEITRRGPLRFLRSR
jgi:SAM-dependent methyltransferase